MHHRALPVSLMWLPSHRYMPRMLPGCSTPALHCAASPLPTVPVGSGWPCVNSVTAAGWQVRDKKKGDCIHQEHPTEVLMHKWQRWQPLLSPTAAVYRSLWRDLKLMALWMLSPFKLQVMAPTTCARDFALPPLPIYMFIVTVVSAAELVKTAQC